MDKSDLEKITEGVLPLIREMVREEVKNLGDGHGAHCTHVTSELEVPFKDNFEIVLFMKRPALMDGLRKRIERLQGSPDQLAARLVDSVFAKSYVATHEFSTEPFPCAKCASDENGEAKPSSRESVPLPFLNWLVGVVGERLSPDWVSSWKVCCCLRHAFCGPKDRAEIAAGRLIKLDRDLKRRESRALRGN